MKTGIPFARSRAMMAAITAIMQSSMDGLMRDAAIAKLGTYRSRGKGRGLIGKRYFKSRSKYEPHDGKQQAARHQRQGQRMVVVNGFELMNAAQV